jgi:hypothetical protein
VGLSVVPHLRRSTARLVQPFRAGLESYDGRERHRRGTHAYLNPIAIEQRHWLLSPDLRHALCEDSKICSGLNLKMVLTQRRNLVYFFSTTGRYQPKLSGR